MIFEYTDIFKRDYQELPQFVRKKFKKAIRLFEADERHPSLRVEKIDAERGIWSARADLQYRFTFNRIEGGIRLRRIAAHVQAYRRP